jgi:hypothetical protein
MVGLTTVDPNPLWVEAALHQQFGRAKNDDR